ncbi:hypothetical protein FRC12_016496 [Ceratobasidium sp. 428]|nr:hypothetical protein FRC12_016496 [Ceratobasidium sp. 428]
MSQQYPPSNDEQHTTTPGFNALPARELQEEFQPFPARVRSSGGVGAASRSRSSGYLNAQSNAPSNLAPDSSHLIQTVNDANTHESGWPATRTDLSQRQQTSTLPPLPSGFTPFPGALPSSRYAPPPRPRVESTGHATSHMSTSESTAGPVLRAAPPAGEPRTDGPTPGTHIPR